MIFRLIKLEISPEFWLEIPSSEKMEKQEKFTYLTKSKRYFMPG